MKQEQGLEESHPQRSVQSDAARAFLWLRVLKGRIGSEAAVKEIFAEQGVHFFSDCFAVLVAMVEEFGQLEDADARDSVLGAAHTKACRLVGELLSAHMPAGVRLYMVDAEPAIVGVFNLSEETGSERGRLEAALTDVEAQLERDYGLKLSTVLSGAAHSLYGVSHGYESAYEQLELARLRHLAAKHRPARAAWGYPDIGPPGSELLARKRQFLNCLLSRDYANARRLALWMAEGDTREMSSYKEFLARRDNLTFDLVLALEQLVPKRDDAGWGEPYRLIMRLSECRSHGEYGEMLDRIFDCFDRLAVDLETKASSEKLRQALRYIHDNISNPDLSVADIAAHMQLSSSQATRLMRAGQGMGTQEYIQQRRIALAKRYLLETELSVSEISAIVGYHSFKTMNRAFKKLCGMTGQQYRHKYAKTKHSQ